MLNLTPEERRVVLFLITIACIGIGVDFACKRYATAKTLSSWSWDIAKINLNTADKDYLMAVPGIKEKLADRIIEYRVKEGDFHTLEELKNIKGITDYKFQKIKDSFYVK